LYVVSETDEKQNKHDYIFKQNKQQLTILFNTSKTKV